MTSFFRPKPLKLKNKQHTTVWNTTFYHPANFKLKQIKNGKVAPKWPLLASCLPTVFREVMSLTNSRGSRVAGRGSKVAVAGLRSQVQSRGRGSNVAAGENDLGFEVTE